MSKEAEKIRTIYKLLFDVATGRRILEPHKLSSPDIFDQLSLRVYDLGETLRDLVLASGMVPPHADIEHIISYVFVLDAQYRIVDLNAKAAERLGYPVEALRHQGFESLLSVDSVQKWQRFVNSAHDKPQLFVGVNLTFKATNGTQLPLLCTFCDGVYSEWVFVLSIEVNLVLPATLDTDIQPFKEDAQTTEKVHAHPLGHLDDALPPVRTLALTYGIEPSKLQRGFKLFYGKTIYRYYQEERLRKGYQLIITTRLHLKEIAYQCGFDAYINFYKAFKKAYGIAPSALLRP